MALSPTSQKPLYPSPASDPEAYDLWVSATFGTSPIEDIAVFTTELESVLASHTLRTFSRTSSLRRPPPLGARKRSASTPRPSAPPSPINITVAAAATGRIPRDLVGIIDARVAEERLTSFGATCARKTYRITALEREPAMRTCAEARQGTAEARRRESWATSALNFGMEGGYEPRPRCAGTMSGAADVAVEWSGTFSSDGDAGAASDLIILGEGSVGRLVGPGEMGALMGDVARRLKGSGRAVVSVLRELMYDSSRKDSGYGSDGAGLVDYEAVVQAAAEEESDYTAPSSVEAGVDVTMTAGVQRLECERAVKAHAFDVIRRDREGRELGRRSLAWAMRTIDPRELEDVAKECGLDLLKRVEGSAQVWFVFGHGDQC